MGGQYLHSSAGCKDPKILPDVFLAKVNSCFAGHSVQFPFASFPAVVSNTARCEDILRSSEIKEPFLEGGLDANDDDIQHNLPGQELESNAAVVVA